MFSVIVLRSEFLIPNGRLSWWGPVRKKPFFSHWGMKPFTFVWEDCFLSIKYLILQLVVPRGSLEGMDWEVGVVVPCVLLSWLGEGHTSGHTVWLVTDSWHGWVRTLGWVVLGKCLPDAQRFCCLPEPYSCQSLVTLV